MHRCPTAAMCVLFTLEPQNDLHSAARYDIIEPVFYLKLNVLKHRNSVQVKLLRLWALLCIHASVQYPLETAPIN